MTNCKICGCEIFNLSNICVECEKDYAESEYENSEKAEMEADLRRKYGGYKDED